MMMSENESYNKPYISFIVTDYNLPIALLRECIESVISLDIPHDKREIILVDDGSETSPEEELKDIMPQIIFIRQENRGLSVARNVGIEASHGEYIQFVDGDDCLLPYYNECFKVLEDNCFDLLLFNRTSQKTTAFPGKTVNFGSGIDYMLNHNIYASAWGYAFRRDILEEGIHFSEGILHEDEEFTPLLILKAKTIAKYEGSAYYYRQRENSIIHTTDKEHIRRRINDFIGVIERLHSQADTLQGNSRKALARRVDQLTMDLVYNVSMLTHDANSVDKAMALLKDKGITPMPIKTYTMKYLGFALLMNSSIGRRIFVKYLSR